MKIVTAPSKSSQVASYLRNEILSGKFAPGTRLATVRNLAEQLSVSRKVIESAFDILSKEQLIIRKSRSGTFVADQNSIQQKTVAILMETSGHIYEKLSKSLLTEFQKLGFLSIVVNYEEFPADKTSQREILQDLLTRNLDGLIIDGIGAFPFELLIEYQNELPRLGFIHRCENPYAFDALKVVSDGKTGAYLATKHLIDSGYKKIMFVTIDPVNFIDTIYYPECDHHKTMIGDQQALAEAGLEKQIFYVNDRNYPEIKNTLLSSDPPDAIFTLGDYRAKQVIDLCKETNLKIPEDLAIMGYWDTPWTEMLDITLSSINIQEELMAKTLVSKFTSDDFIPEKILIPPQLMVRESSGG